MRKCFLLILLLLPMIASAYDFESNGLYFNIDGNSVIVTNNPQVLYSGDVIIPSTVTYMGKRYPVTTIGQSAFKNSIDLRTVSIPSSVFYIKDYAFEGCEGILSLYLPSSIMSIGNRSFSGCTNLISITIPENVYSIGYESFLDCTNLLALSMPNSLRFIGRNAFKGCISLADIWSDIYPISFLWMESGVYDDIPLSTCILHVPKGTSVYYQMAPQWRDFYNINESIQFQAGDVNGDGQVDISDVTRLIDGVLNGDIDEKGDVSGDNQVDISDVTFLIDMILNGSGSSEVDEKIDVSLAEESLYDIYKSMYTPGWSTTGNSHQCFGISAYNLMAEAMGDDFIIGAQGSGWFWFDAVYNVKSRYTSTAWRSYDLWNAYYTWIAHANAIIKSKPQLDGNESDINAIIGQAYAIRAYSYFMLAQTFARTYKGHESDPCVPINDELTYSPPTDAPRAIVNEVYTHISNDIDRALELLQGKDKKHPINIDYMVTLGLKSRIALVKEEWDIALNAAEEVIESNDYRILNVNSFIGMNNCSLDNVMWGAKRIVENISSDSYANLFAHMSSSSTAYAPYANRAPKQISKWLYNKMNSTDSRRSWWLDSWSDWGGPSYDLVQNKFDYSNESTLEGDYIWMRIEEMYLNAAEAACRLGNFNKAKEYLMELMSKRDPNYTCNKTGSALGTLTTDQTGSLLEEILIQRRLELWGEEGRIYTIRRLHQGFQRTTEMGWPNGALIPNVNTQDPESFAWVLTLPLMEFIDNPYLNLTYDQNPLEDTPSTGLATGPQNVSFESETHVVETALSEITIQVKLNRSSAEGSYSTIVLFENGQNMALTSGNVVTFIDGQSTAYVTVKASNLILGSSGFCTLSLSPSEIANGSDDSRITTTRIQVVCANVEPENQNISFDTESQIITSDDDEVNNVSVPVKLTRGITTHSYTAIVKISTSDENVTLQNKYVVFDVGQDTAYTYVDIRDIQKNVTYTCVLSLSDDDIATANPEIGGQIISTNIMYKCLGQNWVPAGTCTFIDHTWEDGYSAENVPIERIEDSNQYRIVSPLYYVYNGIYDNPSTSNWVFTLNDDNSISPVEGEWNMNYWNYTSFYDSVNYPDYCYVEQDGYNYDVYFIVKSGTNFFPHVWFRFSWDRE